MVFRRAKKSKTLWNIMSSKSSASSKKSTTSAAEIAIKETKKHEEEGYDDLQESKNANVEKDVVEEAILKTASTSTNKPYVPLNQRLEMQGVQLKEETNAAVPSYSSQHILPPQKGVNLLPELDRLCLPIENNECGAFVINENNVALANDGSFVETDGYESRDDIHQVYTDEELSLRDKVFNDSMTEDDEFSAEFSEDLSLNLSEEAQMSLVSEKSSSPAKLSSWLPSSGGALCATIGQFDQLFTSSGAAVACSNLTNKGGRTVFNCGERQSSKEKAEMRRLAKMEERKWREAHHWDMDSQNGMYGPARRKGAKKFAGRANNRKGAVLAE